MGRTVRQRPIRFVGMCCAKLCDIWPFGSVKRTCAPCSLWRNSSMSWNRPLLRFRLGRSTSRCVRFSKRPAGSTRPCLRTSPSRLPWAPNWSRSITTTRIRACRRTWRLSSCSIRRPAHCWPPWMAVSSRKLEPLPSPPSPLDVLRYPSPTHSPSSGPESRRAAIWKLSR